MRDTIDYDAKKLLRLQNWTFVGSEGDVVGPFVNAWTARKRICLEFGYIYGNGISPGLAWALITYSYSMKKYSTALMLSPPFQGNFLKV